LAAGVALVHWVRVVGALVQLQPELIPPEKRERERVKSDENLKGWLLGVGMELGARTRRKNFQNCGIERRNHRSCGGEKSLRLIGAISIGVVGAAVRFALN
jgi:hypothetical protein